MTFEEFMQYVYEAANCEGYIDRESECLTTIEEVIGLNFKPLTDKEIFAFIQGMKLMYEMQNERWLYFEDREERVW